jgi:MFS family permease
MTQALLEPSEPVSLRFQILFGLANASLTLAVIPILTILIPAQVSLIDPANTAVNLAVVLPLGAIGAMIGNPLAGALSDRTTSRFGRRRPWILAGTLVTSAGLALLANSQSIFWLAAGWFIVQFFGNMLFSAYTAILPDRVPVEQRGTTQAILGLISPVVMLAGAYYLGRVQDFRAGYYPVILVLVVVNALFIWFYREPAQPKSNIPPFRAGAFLSSFWINPRREPNFALAWLTWLLIWTGYTLGTGGILFLYVQNVIQYPQHFPGHEVKEGISNLQVLQTICGVPLMMIAAVLSDRWQRRKVFVSTGAFLVFIGYGFLFFFPEWSLTMIAGTAIGAGFSIFYSLGLALISQILPSARSRGKDLGVINIASTIPQIFIPGIAAAVLQAYGSTSPEGYQILFCCAGITLCLGILLNHQIKGVN